MTQKILWYNQYCSSLYDSECHLCCLTLTIVVVVVKKEPNYFYRSCDSLQNIISKKLPESLNENYVGKSARKLDES